MGKLGLALGGGGFRGSAHLGVLQELERLEVGIDAISGTSIGAVVGALVAAGYRAAEIGRAFQFVSARSLLGRDPTRHGLLGPQKLALILADLLGDRLIEDLRIPFAAVTVDLVSGAEVALDRGPLVEALLASTAIPGLFPPRQINGQLLADGGLLANLPVAAVRRLGAERVIAVDLVRDEAPFALQPAGRPTLLSRWLPLRQAALAERAILLMLQSMTEASLRDYPADVLIAPAVNQASTGTFLPQSAGVDAGVAAAARHYAELVALREWRLT